MLRGSVYCDIYHSVVQYYVVANLLTVYVVTARANRTTV